MRWMFVMIRMILLSSTFTLKATSQKPVLDSSAVANWSSMSYFDAAISNDGKYFYYSIEDRSPNGNTLVVQNTSTLWKREFKGVLYSAFSITSRDIIVFHGDTLSIQQLGSDICEKVLVSSFKASHSQSPEWLAYQLYNNSSTLILRNLRKKLMRFCSSVESYSFDQKGESLILKTVVNNNGLLRNTVSLIDLKNNNEKIIWSASVNSDSSVSTYAFDAAGRQIALLIEEKKNVYSVFSLYYYNKEMKTAELLVNNQFAEIPADLTISGSTPIFSLNGKFIFFNLISAPAITTLKPDAIKLDIWSYKDSIIQSKQLFETPVVPPKRQEYRTVINPASGRLIQLVKEDESVAVGVNDLSKINSEYILITQKNSINDYWWKSYSKSSSYLVSLEDGSRRLVNLNSKSIIYVFSPSAKYLVYFDRDVQSYFSYELKSGLKRKISAGIPTSLTRDFELDLIGNRSFPVGIAGWLVEEESILIYDNYDIWKVDLSNSREPVNITYGIGLRNSIKFRIVGDGGMFSNALFSIKDQLLISAFNVVTKHNGFYKKQISKPGYPELLTMGPYHYFTTGSQVTSEANFSPIKAKEDKNWIVLRESAVDAPNFFLTNNFKIYKQLTHFRPSLKYNWVQTELITWTQLDSTSSQGVLFTPENFDSTKKYPVIFSYYQQKSQIVYQYPQIDFLGSDITSNIPWFVSRGYLVFSPDIHYKVGRVGESAVNSVISAAKYLSKLPFVDASKLALSGHSFGGMQTNYIITHSNIFAAAATASGVSDFVSFYGGLQGDRYSFDSNQWFSESSQLRMGGHLWDKLELYIENSAVFKVDKIETPVLIMHNKNDQAVPWMQSVELFTGLRRLQKKAWMLQYDEGGHGVHIPKDKIDFTIRQTQFFDHYLKNFPPPKWMTRGRPASLKGIDDRLELDPLGFCGEDCKICKEKNYDMNAVLDVMNPNKKKEDQQAATKTP